MRYLVDTNVWIHYLKNASSPVASRLQKTPASEVAVCSIVWAELLHGARKYERRDDRAARVERTLSPYRSLAFDDAAARKYAVVRDDLESRGEVIGANDLLIASIALSHGLILVTNDADFGRVTGLPIEDWTAANTAS